MSPSEPLGPEPLSADWPYRLLGQVEKNGLLPSSTTSLTTGLAPTLVEVTSIFQIPEEGI